MTGRPRGSAPRWPGSLLRRQRDHAWRGAELTEGIVRVRESMTGRLQDVLFLLFFSRFLHRLRPVAVAVFAAQPMQRCLQGDVALLADEEGIFHRAGRVLMANRRLRFASTAREPHPSDQLSRTGWARE